MANRPRISASVSKVMAKGGRPSGASASTTTTTSSDARNARDTAYASLPSRPPGRSTRTASITRYMKASARSGR